MKNAQNFIDSHLTDIGKALETQFEIIDLLISDKILNSWENKSLNSWENTFKFYCNLQLTSYFHKINWKLGKTTKQQTNRYHGDITFESIPFDLFIAKLHAFGMNENTLVFIYSYLKRTK